MRNPGLEIPRLHFDKLSVANSGLIRLYDFEIKIIVSLTAMHLTRITS